MAIRERVCVELGALRPRWDAWCTRRGVTTSDGVRQLIALAVNAEEGDRAIAIESEPARAMFEASRSRIELRLTVAERQAVEQRAGPLGLNSNRWIVSLVRAQLTREPQVGQRELLELCASNQQLAVINRSLGQIARGYEPHLLRQNLTELDDIRNRLDGHLLAVARVIRANLDRWSR
jgi:hypothetical protein